MKKYILLLLFCSSLISIKAQSIGVTSYTSNYFTTNASGNRQIVSQSPNGDIWIYNYNGGLVKFSGNSFTTYTNTFGVSPDMNVFATNNGVWMFSNYGFLYYYNGSTYTDHSAAITSIIGTITATNSINYIGNNGTDILIATTKGIVKYSGSAFSIINKTNSNLICDTINCILNNGVNTYVGTDKGLCTYNGTSFSPSITFPGALSHQVNYIFSNGIKTIVTRKSATADFEYYNLNGNSLIKIASISDSANYTSKLCSNISFVNNNPVFSGGTCARIIGAAGTYTYYCGAVGGRPFNSFKHPSNTQKFYIVAHTAPFSTPKFTINEFDIPNYASISLSGSPDQVKYLDTNNVRALISEANTKHWDIFGNGDANYTVPKGPLNTSPSTNFATALWVGGLDNIGQLHIAAQTYRQNGTDFWPGPLDTLNAQTTITKGQPYNKVWKISCNQINQFTANYNSFNAAANSATTYSDINTFIANGNNTNNFAKQLSSYKDWNLNGIYESALGEYPVIKGHQQIYSVYNDAFATHTETGGLKLGIEVHDRSFSYNEPFIADSMKVINYTTFYNYEVINRSSFNYNNVYMSVWVDADIGYYGDDYIGTDTLNNFGYAYNGDNFDETAAGSLGYGAKLPMMGYALIPQTSALTDGVDNDNDGLIDEAGENFKLNFTTYYNNNVSSAFPPATTNPDTSIHYYNYMKGYWKDNSPFKPTGTAYNPTLTINPTHYVYSGNPQTNTGWTETTANNFKGDRRILCTVGPFNFPAGKKVEFEYAFVFSRDTSLNNLNNNFSLLQKDVKNVRHYRNLQNACTPVATVGLKENKSITGNLWIYPNPTNELVTINLDHNVTTADVKLYDVTGKIIYTNTINNTYQTTINLNNFSAGVYFLEIKEGEFKRVEKIIKQ